MAKDYYDILGVSKTATKDEIKKAFHKKAHQYHPDKQNGDEVKFKEANEAYQVLSNDEKRKQYDQFGSTFDQAGFNGAGAGAGGFNWSDFARQGGGGFGGFSGGAGPGFAGDFDFGDIFGDIFGGGRSRSRRVTRGADIEASLEIDFLESIFGVNKTVRLQKNIICSRCKGNGAEPGTEIKTCSTCGGNGQVEQVQRTILGAMRTVGVCPDCKGEGKKPEKLCSRCGGQGIIRDAEAIEIKIPAGISHGQQIRFSGKGEAGVRGVPAGDLYITVSVKADNRFERSGDDIKTTEPISFKQAALGDKIDVQTVHGEVQLKIPEGTQSGKVFKLKSKGVPHLNGGGHGDHLVKVQVVTPSHLSRAQKKALEELD